MKSGGGFLLVFIGLLVLWMAITGKLSCFSAFVDCMTGKTAGTSGGASGSAGGGWSVPPLPSINFPATGGVMK